MAEADEAEGLDHAGADDHVGEETAGNLGLAGGRFLGLADHEADAEAGAQGGEAVADVGECCGSHSGFLLLVTPGGVGGQ